MPMESGRGQVDPSSALGQPRRSDETSGMSALRLIGAECCTAVVRRFRPKADLDNKPSAGGPTAKSDRSCMPKPCRLAIVRQLTENEWPRKLRGHSQMRCCLSLVDSMRSIDKLAISCFDLGVALPSSFPAVIVPLGLIGRTRKGRGNHNKYRRGHCSKKHLFHDSLLRELHLDPGF